MPGHEGKLVFSTMGSRRVPVVLLVGRAQSVFPIFIYRYIVSYMQFLFVSHVSSIRMARRELSLTQAFELFIVSTKVTAWKPSPSPLVSAKSWASKP